MVSATNNLTRSNLSESTENLTKQTSANEPKKFAGSDSVRTVKKNDTQSSQSLWHEEKNQPDVLPNSKPITDKTNKHPVMLVESIADSVRLGLLSEEETNEASTANLDERQTATISDNDTDTLSPNEKAQITINALNNPETKFIVKFLVNPVVKEILTERGADICIESIPVDEDGNGAEEGEATSTEPIDIATSSNIDATQEADDNETTQIGLKISKEILEGLKSQKYKIALVPIDEAQAAQQMVKMQELWDDEKSLVQNISSIYLKETAENGSTLNGYALLATILLCLSAFNLSITVLDIFYIFCQCCSLLQNSVMHASLLTFEGFSLWGIFDGLSQLVYMAVLAFVTWSSSKSSFSLCKRLLNISKTPELSDQLELSHFSSPVMTSILFTPRSVINLPGYISAAKQALSMNQIPDSMNQKNTALNEWIAQAHNQTLIQLQKFAIEEKGIEFVNTKDQCVVLPSN